ncbi:MAG: SH3 domain-containing protein [Anaerolineaceae bacterium]|nr:SH3 domain-containing protein [Anaerolineaceae bacterium]
MTIRLRQLVKILTIAALAAGLLGGGLVAFAGSDGGASFALDCAGFTGTGGSITLDRDNTGNQREAFVLSATDGVGNVIYEPIEDSFFVGGTVSWDGGDTVTWTATPQYNPLTLRVMSRAGNGFDEQLILLVSGSCDTLPSYNVMPSDAFFVVGDTLTIADGTVILPAGITSPPVELNSTPPRSQNADETIEALSGFALVNTDNLSLRSGDGPEYTLVGVVDGGDKLIVLGRNANFSWWYVQAGGLVGWASAEFLIMRGNFLGIPVVQSQGEITQPRFVLYSSHELLGTPSASSAPLCTIEGNLEYLVVGRTKSASWYEVQAMCDGVLVNGWLPDAQGALRNPAGVFIPVTG